VIEHRHHIGDDVVALTFDDGPSPWTGPILDLLAAHEGHATFFTLGCLADANGAEQTLHRILESGSEIGNHTFSHPSLPSLEDDSIRDELERAGSAIEEARATPVLASTFLPRRRARAKSSRR
jgi:peptidoglycan/xylan/chitin deacetylase (PgdA/CDA1 family)